MRSKEMDLRIRELDNNTAHAEKILLTQERDRQNERLHVFRRDIVKICLIGFGVLALVVVMLVGMYLNKDALVSDILKIVSGAVLGALGGYGLGKSKGKKKKSRKTQSRKPSLEGLSALGASVTSRSKSNH
ncbi:hypothetical protein [Variovorax paradoxus]|uniref:hypothetical protein n=1 Tax=Variovorax paradoxus TaxID=34073 RepID=UPI003D645D08